MASLPVSDASAGTAGDVAPALACPAERTPVCGRVTARRVVEQFEAQTEIGGHLVGPPAQHIPVLEQRTDRSSGGCAGLDHHAGETRVHLFPLTGRSHQLRVHMLSLGHPILGDPIYATGAALAFPRLMLHAETLSLHHPDSGEWMTFSAPCPF